MILTKLFNLMIMFEYVPNDFGKSILIPIPKTDCVNASANVEDYRGISIAPVISKVFEQVLLHLYEHFLVVHRSSFGTRRRRGMQNSVLEKTVNFLLKVGLLLTLARLTFLRPLTN